MNKKIFVSTADALAYIIKRLDGTEVLIGDEDGDEPTPGDVSTTKTLRVKTYAIYAYESQFLMQVPSDAPNFTSFLEVIPYLESVGKVMLADGSFVPKNSDISNYSDYMIPITGIFANMHNANKIMIVKNTDYISPKEFDAYRIYTYGLFDPDGAPYSSYGSIGRWEIFPESAGDDEELVYADDFEISPEQEG
jgi:hypothetical protein